MISDIWNWSYTWEFTLPVDVVIGAVCLIVSSLIWWYIGHQKVTGRHAPKWQTYLGLVSLGWGLLFMAYPYVQ